MRVLVAAALAAMALSACGESHSSTATAQLSVVLLLAGPENDEGWNQSAYEGLDRIKTELDATGLKITARRRAEIERSLADAAAKNTSLILGHGFEFNAPAAQVAAEYPDLAFATTGGTETADNLAVIELRLEEAAYELGVLAGHLTETGKLSVLAGEKFEPVERVNEGFRSGAQSVRPDVEVFVEYLGSWEDASLAKEKAFAHADAGCDLFFQNADAAGVGVFEACRERGTLAFGCNRDQTVKAPDVILASAVAEIPETLLALAQEVADGSFQGGRRSFGVREDKVRVALNPAMAERVTTEIATAMERARTAIRETGTLPTAGADSDQ